MTTRTLHTNALFIVIFGALTTATSFSQITKEAAVRDPLSTAFYLLSSTDKDSRREEKACLANSFAKVDRFKEARETAELVGEFSYTTVNYNHLVNELIERGLHAEASKITSLLMNRAKGDSYTLTKFLNLLVKLKRTDEAFRVVNEFDESEKINGYIEISKAAIEQKQLTAALRALDLAAPIVEKSNYIRELSQLGLLYAKAGNKNASLKFLNSTLNNIYSAKKSLDVDQRFALDDAFATYLAYGDFRHAEDLRTQIQKHDGDARSLIRFTRAYLDRYGPKEADSTIARARAILNPGEYGDSFYLRDLSEIYLQIKTPEKALEIAEEITSNEFIRQQELLKVADYFAKNRNTERATEVLDFAYRQTLNIDVSKPESGLASTSEKWEQANYQAAIARFYLRLGMGNRFRRVSAEISKPYLKALILTEYVKKFRNREPKAKLQILVDQALSLVRNGRQEIFDSNRYTTFAKVARSYAEIGMPEKAIEVFANVLSRDKQVSEDGGNILTTLCNIGIEFEKSKIAADEKVTTALRNIVNNWENDEY